MGENKIQDKFDKLPKEAQNVIDEFDFDKVYKKIKKEYSLTERQIHLFDGEVASALVLDRHPNNMKENLVVPDDGETFSPELAEKLHAEFYSRILNPIMDEMESRGISFGEKRQNEKDMSNKIYEDKRVRVTNSKLEWGGSSYPIRNISKVTNLSIANWSFGGGIVNAGAFLLGLVALGQGVGGIIVGVILMAIGGFNLYNMINEPYKYTVEVGLVSDEDISIEYTEKEKAKELRRAIEKSM